MADVITKELIVLTVNGERRELEVDRSRTLLDVLREDLDLTGAKEACDNGECGSCAVLLGNKGLMSCLLSASRAQGKEVTTIEGLASRHFDKLKGQDGDLEQLHPLQEAFIELGASQCGFCIPGIIMEAEALLNSNPNPTREDVVKRLSRNLCRCTGYTKIIDAVLYASELMRVGDKRVKRSNQPGPVVGQRILRSDNRDHVTGLAKYAADLKLEGMLYAKILRSPHHHARILNIDTSEAEAMPGVEAVITYWDIPGNPIAPNHRPQPFLLAKDKVDYMGAAVAAVAAVSEEIAAEALTRIKVEYEPLPAVLDMLEAMKDDSIQILPSVKNAGLVTTVVQGDVEKGFAEADVIVENTYSTPTWEHAPMEPEAALAYMGEDNQIVIHAPHHHPYVGRDFLANMLAVERDQVRIITPTIGGNFGHRGEFVADGVIALLVLKTKKPVKIVFSREESMLGSAKGESAYHMRYKTGATKAGKLIALEADILTNEGCWRPEDYQYGNQPAIHCTGPYYIPNVLVKVYDVCTNMPRAVPIRSVERPAMGLSVDSQLDILAARLGLDPLEFRLRNVLEVGSRTHTGEILKESVGIKATLEALRGPYAEALAWAASEPPASAWRRGVGLGSSWLVHSSGTMGPVAKEAKAAAELMEDGRVQVLAGVVEKGQGPFTIFAQMAAEELGVPMESVTLNIGDTHLAPYPYKTGGQMATTQTGGAVLNACQRLKQALAQEAAKILEEEPDNIVFQNGQVSSLGFPEEKLSLRQLAAHLRTEGVPTRYEGAFVWEGGAHQDPETGQTEGFDYFCYQSMLAQVEVNVETGQVRLPEVVLAADAGNVINPMIFEGQLQGGVVNGLGFALKEKYVPGETLTLKAYGMPTIRDAPTTVKTLFVGEPFSKGPFGAKGGGEMCCAPPVPAIINGIANAIEARIYHLPATPDKILEALGKG